MSRVPRRRLLAAGALAGATALAGCVGGFGDGAAVTPRASSDCAATEPPAPSDAAAPPRAYPEPPSELTDETVGSFVAAFERAYQYNRALAEDPQKIGRLNELEVSVEEPTVESEGGRFTVSVAGDHYYRIATPDSTVTPTPTVTPLPMGRGRFDASYVVTRESVRREGTVVYCW